ncbi:hypothetical protein CYMTET_52198 [Cymbomonas tetramitiformis]|uniref:CCZ1/INTU/HSP4 first Longin domain-containing protein n=1 Tax=Cymbomonas tetramitiformis TaxID=36881 RepID=A0AAE0BKN7_9CHLO|nr:hypothetical protein CYMTET_52198 [Cymbomonas tetramitiformis]
MADAGSRLALFLFDRSRPCREGCEEEKLISFFPSAASQDRRKGFIGLVEGLINFTSIFSPDKPCELMRAGRHRQILLQCEPEIWMVLIVGEDIASSEVRTGAIRQALKETYEAIVLLTGSLRNAITEDATLQRVRRNAAPIMSDMWARMTAPKRNPTNEFNLLTNSLSGREGMPLLPLPRSMFLSVQFIVNVLESAYGGNTVLNTMILFDHQLVWTGLPPSDARALYRFASRCLLPQQVASGSRSRARSSSMSAPPEPATAFGTPFRPGEWKAGSDGFLTATDPSPGEPRVPLIHSTNGTKYQLVVYHQEAITLLLLFKESAPEASSAAYRNQLSGMVDAHLRTLGPGLEEHFQAPNRWHVPGYRYLFVDRALSNVRHSPDSKVATLSKESLAVLGSLRSQLEELDALKGGISGWKRWPTHDPQEAGVIHPLVPLLKSILAHH